MYRCIWHGRGELNIGPTVACDTSFFPSVITDLVVERSLIIVLSVLARGTQFILSRDELLTLPEFVLLSLFPNGLFPDGQVNSYHDDGIYIVDVCFGLLSPG
jgi:hypothetical protein